MRFKKGSISEFILLVLEKTVDGYVRIEDFAYHHYRYHYGAPELDKSALAMALKRLREGGLIEKEIDQEQVIIKLTNLGKDILDDWKFDDSKWDGKYRIVLFDIPEKHKVVRDLLRRKLKNWKFEQWQKSVWLGKKDITEKLREVIKELEIDRWVAIFESVDPIFSNVKLSDRLS